MFATIRNPKSDLISQATERRTIFPQLALRRRANEHPIAMFGAIAAAAFVWTLVPGEPMLAQASKAPTKLVQETRTTAKTSRLSIADLDRACHGQAWGDESAACVKMIVKENGKADVKVRVIADAAPANLTTPNVF
jgi:hypothetical protein